MILLNKNDVLKYFNAPGKKELENWCQANDYQGIYPSNDTEGGPSDYVVAAALWYVENKYPRAETVDKCSFAGVVHHLSTGWSGPWPTEEYEKNIQAENIILYWAGGVPPAPGDIFAWGPKEPPTSDFTRRALEFLEAFYFVDSKQAVKQLLDMVDKDMAARIIMGLAANQKDYDNIISRIKKGDLLTVSQVAEEYGITDRTVRDACKKKRLTEDEAVEVSFGWLITRKGADRLWGNRKS